MNVTEELDRFRGAVAECDVALLVDLSTSMVLSSSAAVKRPQEELDSLAESAGAVLGGPIADAALFAVAETDDEAAMLGVLATDEDMRAVLRADPARPEVLICVCGAGADLSEVVSKGRTALSTIMAHS